MQSISLKFNNKYWERDYTAPPWFSRLVCSDGSLTVVYTSPYKLEKDNA